MPISWDLKASAHYVLRYLASVIVDGKCKYLKMSALQKNIITSQFIECCIDDFHDILKSIKKLV